jgi:hypothetical protein
MSFIPNFGFPLPADDFKDSVIRVIRKARKTQHQNPKLGHTQCKIKNKPSNKYISVQPLQGGWGGGGGGGLSAPKSSHFCVN